MTDVDFLTDSRKKHDIPLENLDFKYVEKCQNVKELEKIYRVLVSGAEGKYPDLENYVYNKIKTLSPNSRVLRKDLPIFTKQALSKSEQEMIDSDILNFVKEIPNLEKKVICKTKTSNEETEPPIRSTKQSNIITSGKNTAKPLTQEIKNTNGTKKSVKPKDYREWEKIEKQIDKELDEKENVETVYREASDKTVVNKGKNFSKALIKDLPKDINTENLDESEKTLKADQEKCKGNEAFAAACYQEAVTYYTRSIKYLPTAASYNNRALACNLMIKNVSLPYLNKQLKDIKLENWEKAVQDCNEVLKHEKDNFKALLRRATALHKQRNYEKAKIDIDKCLALDSTDKKAKELKIQIDADLRKHQEEIEKLKSAGGKRLQIEETDGSEEESEDENKKIPIAEVESDSEEEDQAVDAIKSDDNVKSSLNSTEQVQTSVKLDQEITKEPVLEEKKFELPEPIVQSKDKAASYFTNGQYAEAVDYYTKSIDLLEEFKKKSDHLFEVNQNLCVLFNNRATSYQNICDYKKCINDCDSGLELIEENVNLKCKLLFKKAYSLEMMEKYEEAFRNYETLMKIDNKFKNVQSNFNRVKSILKENGKMDKVKNQIPQVKEEKIEKNPQQLYEDFKVKGNEFFKNNNYEKACEFYSKCIDLNKENIVAYSNRSLCYVKLKQPDLAIKDTSFVLDKEPNNVKALYRRALAYKDKKELESAINDLKKILYIESNNQIAKDELKNLEILVKDNKIVGEKKIKIEEISENVQVKPETGSKSTLKTTVQPSTIINIPKKIYDFSSITNGYEFLQAWNSISPTDLENYTKLIANVDPKQLHKFIGSKLDDDMLSKLIKCVYKLANEELTTKFNIFDYLESITKTQRFEVTKLFINKDQKQMLLELIAKIENGDKLKKLFSI